MKITKDQMVEGHTYLTKDQKEVVYLGRYNFTEFKSKYYDTNFSSEKYHIFRFVKDGDEDNSYNSWRYSKERKKYWLQKGFTKLAKKLSNEPISNFSELFDEFAKSEFSSKPIGVVEEDKTIIFPQITQKYSYSANDNPPGHYYLKDNENKWIEYEIRCDKSYNYNTRVYSFKGYRLNKTASINFNNGIIKINQKYDYSNKHYSKEELKNFNFKDLKIELESGKKVKIHQK